MAVVAAAVDVVGMDEEETGAEDVVENVAAHMHVIKPKESTWEEEEEAGDKGGDEMLPQKRGLMMMMTMMMHLYLDYYHFPLQNVRMCNVRSMYESERGLTTC